MFPFLRDGDLSPSPGFTVTKEQDDDGPRDGLQLISPRKAAILAESSSPSSKPTSPPSSQLTKAADPGSGLDLPSVPSNLCPRLPSSS
ncbi:hypothetical protein GLOTRDRAFT_130066 [Gloeophyllum trabeum ATCC 11539]|uniref:Uncharacterized protein n=1 Tax=Gloeophyllum trabeum (strain ATCC 11539 / FP-39264 / Madison 617) TaxID=670483 RepID=S7RK06_GLOTA|nr:uncharacterized protein GLOTRDRAFT_130066 [Gloeophyllum trabeum ATCC 11539]EPQ54715.1 hypothetical protein GLOTRDRAFT_130066 [Gloeophyllum trabeum ATCC 11539]